jgi:hypothetical protein
MSALGDGLTPADSLALRFRKFIFIHCEPAPCAAMRDQRDPHLPPVGHFRFSEKAPATAGALALNDQQKSALDRVIDHTHAREAGAWYDSPSARGAVDIDPIGACQWRRRPPRRPADRAIAIAINKIGDPAAPAARAEIPSECSKPSRRVIRNDRAQARPAGDYRSSAARERIKHHLRCRLNLDSTLLARASPCPQTQGTPAPIDGLAGRALIELLNQMRWPLIREPRKVTPCWISTSFVIRAAAQGSD